MKKQIGEEAERTAQLLLQDAQTEAQRITKDGEREIKEYAKEARGNAEKMLAALEKKELAAAEFEGKRRILDKKKEVIERVMDEAKKALKKLPAEERRKIIATLLEKAKQEITAKRVSMNKRDMPYIKEKGIKVKEKDMLGGLIAETADGKVSVNLSFEELLEQIKEKYLQELSEGLFRG